MNITLHIEAVGDMDVAMLRQILSSGLGSATKVTVEQQTPPKASAPAPVAAQPIPSSTPPPLAAETKARVDAAVAAPPVKRGPGRPRKVEVAPPVPTQALVPSTTEEITPEERARLKKELIDVLTPYIEQNGDEALKKAFDKRGYKKLSEMPPSEYPALLDELGITQ